MNPQAKDWKTAADRLWAEATLDYRGAASLVAEMARSEDAALSAAAGQALPGLRAALIRGAERRVRELARRRFGAVRDMLHALSAPRFGKRGSAEMLSPDEQNRRMLGLPLGRRLYGPEIQQAYKRAAKTMHPDVGGSERAFQELSAARDALQKGG